MPRRTLALAIAASGAVSLVPNLLAGSPAQATGDDKTPYCVTDIVGQAPSGEYLLSDQECFADPVDALRHPSALGAPLGTLVLAIHHDPQNRGTPSITVRGSVLCGGGFINWATAQGGAWNDRFESITHGCGPTKDIRHFDQQAFGGCNGGSANIPSFGDLNSLGAMNNATSCVVYGF